MGRMPLVTAFGIASQVVIFTKAIRKIRWPPISRVCVSSANIWNQQQYDRILLSPFFHLNDVHLYFNMASFLWKGLLLEKQLGSGYFLFMICTFGVLSNILYVGLGVTAASLLEDPSYLTRCTTGFSGVLFALKVVASHMNPAHTHHVLGFIPVPTTLVCWAELAIIHILVPNASSMGHFSGILVGLMYIYGPLKSVMTAILPPGTELPFRFGRRWRMRRKKSMANDGHTLPPPPPRRRGLSLRRRWGWGTGHMDTRVNDGYTSPAPPQPQKGQGPWSFFNGYGHNDNGGGGVGEAYLDPTVTHTGGLSGEQLDEAMRHSYWTGGRHPQPSAPLEEDGGDDYPSNGKPSTWGGGGLYPDLSTMHYPSTAPETTN